MSATCPTSTAAGPVRSGGWVAPRRSRRVRPRRRIVRDVFTLNLIPLLDVVFNVLLFLIVVTRFSRAEGLLPAKLPAKGAAPATAFEVPRTPVRVYVSKTAAGPVVRLEKNDADPVPAADLAARFRELIGRPGYDSRTPLYLISEDAVSWDDVVNVYNAALSASFQKIYFIRP